MVWPKKKNKKFISNGTFIKREKRQKAQIWTQMSRNEDQKEPLPKDTERNKVAPTSEGYTTEGNHC